MISIVRRTVVIVMLIPLQVVGAELGVDAGSAPESASQLSVRIYDYAGLPDAMLRRAGEKARRVYRTAGIETVWMLCRVSLDEPVKNAACEQEPGPTVLQMKILPRVMAERFGLAGGVFGFALPPREGGFGNVASIFHHRVQALAEMSGTPAEVILGHMLAHEAGHLLLGVSSHSSKGIMHVPWRVDDLERAEVGRLKFTPQQAARMQQQVAERVEAEGRRAAVASSHAGGICGEKGTGKRGTECDAPHG